MDIKTSAKSFQKQKEVKDLHNPARQKLWIGGYLILCAASLLLYFLFRLKTFDVISAYRNVLLKLLLAAAAAFAVLILARILQGIIAKHSHARAVQYNIIRLIRLITIVIIAFIFISFLNSNWYTAAVSLGLISLLLGFALQTPIASLIGWFYIVIRAPYKVGDRIQVSQFTGDVVEINYFDTTLWEFAGNYMTNDLPSGRLIRFPNSLVFQDEIYNYSWQKFPYIWNEIPFHVAYQSDLDWIENTIRTVAKAELPAEMEEHVRNLRELIKETPVDEIEIKEYPFVNFRINANTWVEVLLVYLVDPKKASAVRTNLIRKILAALIAEPGKVMFPKGDNR
ncbi:MAG TPA: mechanosensitive ion channel domain-containing protein [Parafilimonas sp.]|nr:mechanosensitive ion channel domain-containing protein [Parafilimonas sp.]